MRMGSTLRAVYETLVPSLPRFFMLMLLIMILILLYNHDCSQDQEQDQEQEQEWWPDLWFRFGEPGRSVLVAFVQGVVRAGHEHLSPLDEAGGEKARDRAKNDLLEKCGLHCPFYEAEGVPPRLPKAPLPGGHYPGSEKKIGHGVRDHA